MINVLAKRIHDIAKQKGFYDKPVSFYRSIALIHSEVSEALEGDRNAIPEGEKGCVSEELADVIIRVLDTAEYMGLDMEAALAKKMDYNNTRGHMHGKRY